LWFSLRITPRSAAVVLESCSVHRLLTNCTAPPGTEWKHQHLELTKTGQKRDALTLVIIIQSAVYRFAKPLYG
jgi:hypothetical protein